MMCKEFNVLPEDGGLMDQDHILIRDMDMVLSIIKEADRKKMQEAKNKSSKKG